MSINVFTVFEELQKEHLDHDELISNSIQVSKSQLSKRLFQIIGRFNTKFFNFNNFLLILPNFSSLFPKTIKDFYYAN